MAQNNYPPEPKYVVLIRYKNGMDKMLELTTHYIPIAFPTVVPKSSYANGVYINENELAIVTPVQLITDIKGNLHYIAVHEILDITIEELNE